MQIEDTVEVISNASHKHYKHVGKVIKECNSKWKKMFLVDFGVNGKARFYEDSLKVIDINVSYIQGVYI